MLLPVTAFFTSTLGIFFLFISFLVIGQRRKHKVALGDGSIEIFNATVSNPEKVPILKQKYESLSRLIRVHGNFSEYVPITMLLLGLAELNQALGKNVLMIFGFSVVVGRVCHFFGLQTKSSVGILRVLGVVLTTTPLGLLCFANLIHLINN